MKRAILRCDGALEQGFGAILEIRDAALTNTVKKHDVPEERLRQRSAVFTEVTGALPPALELLELLTAWQQHYLGIVGVSRISLEKIGTQKR